MRMDLSTPLSTLREERPSVVQPGGASVSTLKSNNLGTALKSREKRLQADRYRSARFTYASCQGDYHIGWAARPAVARAAENRKRLVQRVRIGICGIEEHHPSVAVPAITRDYHRAHGYGAALVRLRRKCRVVLGHDHHDGNARGLGIALGHARRGAQNADGAGEDYALNEHRLYVEGRR